MEELIACLTNLICYAKLEYLLNSVQSDEFNKPSLKFAIQNIDVILA